MHHCLEVPSPKFECHCIPAVCDMIEQSVIEQKELEQLTHRLKQPLPGTWRLKELSADNWHAAMTSQTAVNTRTACSDTVVCPAVDEG